MLTKFSRGSVDSWWDRYTRNWITQVKDLEGNQIGNADYSSNRTIMVKLHKCVCEAKYVKELIGDKLE